MTDKDREAFEDWENGYALAYEPNYSPETLADCKAAFLAGMNAARAQPAEREPLSVEAYTALAHRIASKYTHSSDPAVIAYTFLPHTLGDFVRALEAAITKGTP